MVAEAVKGYTPPRWKQLLAAEGLRLMEEEEQRAKDGLPMRDPEATVRLLVARVQREIKAHAD